MPDFFFFFSQDDADAVDNDTMKQRNDEESGDEREDNGEVRAALHLSFSGIWHQECRVTYLRMRNGYVACFISLRADW